MRYFLLLRNRLRSLFRRRVVEAELERELSLHLEQLTRERREAGLSDADALRAAKREFGSSGLIQEQCRDTRRVGWIEDFAKDLRHALRLLGRSPGFALTAVLSLALGIGANTAILSLLNAVVLRSLPVERPHELVFLQSAGTAGRGGAPPYPGFERLRNETSSFTGIAAFSSDEMKVEVAGAVEQVFTHAASGNIFEVLGMTPAAGRLMTGSDDQLDPPVVVIGYSYWQRRFGGDPGVVGKKLALGNRSYTIIGVTPAQFWGLIPGRRVDVTVPITIAGDMLSNPGTWWLDAVARLKPGVGVKQATAEADTIFKSFLNDQGVSGEGRTKHFERMELTPAGRGLDRLRSRFSKPLYVLAVVAGVVLLIACANLGSLLLARGNARAREFAIRLATGAGAGRLMRQLLTETMLIFVLGAAAGLAVAYFTVQGLTGFFAIGRNPILLDVAFDANLAALAAAIALAAGLVTGLWPAVRALRTDPQVAMKDREGRLAGSRQSGVLARSLVVGQIALSLVLLVAAVMFLRTMLNLRTADLGFRPTQVLTMSLDPEFQRAAARGEASAVAREQFWKRVLERVRSLPGVRAASLSVLTPLSGRDVGKFVTVPGFEARSNADRTVHMNHVSEDYFQTFGMELRAGRALTSSDAGSAPRAAILNEAAARAWFGDKNPIGETFSIRGGGVLQVVGVARDSKHKSLREPAPRFAYVPVWQPIDGLRRITLAVSSALPQANLAQVIAQEIRAIHANTLVSDVISVEHQIDATLLSERLLSTLASGFAGLALALAAIGLYGILSYSVARRTAEFGVRMALGATRSGVAWSVLRDVLLQVGAGIALGVPAAIAAARAAQGLLFGVSAADPGNYILAALLLAAVACLGAWFPARRATRVDPMIALRYE